MLCPGGQSHLLCATCCVAERSRSALKKSERDALVLANLPLVGYLVSTLQRRGTHLNREDLVSAGVVGLLAAATNYDPDVGVPFGSYARKIGRAHV